MLAHPFWDIDEPGEVAALIGDLDLDGVECFYPAHDREQTRSCWRSARTAASRPRAPSDFHGPSHKMFDRFGSYPTYDLGAARAAAQARVSEPH